MKQPKHRKKVLPKRLKNKYNYPGQALYQETFPPLSAVVSAAAFADCYGDGHSSSGGAAGDGGVRPISCMYTKCRLCADIRYRKGKLVLPKGKEAHLLIEGGWGNILMHPDTSVGARNEVKLYE